MIAGVNRTLDRWVRPEVVILGTGRSAFQVWGFAGWVTCSAAALWVAWIAGASLWIVASMTLVASLAFLATAAITKVITGTARLVFYHHAIAITAAVAGLLVAIDAAVAPYLDIAAIALATFLCFGRIGCLLVGCCHGMPAHVGARYRDEHVAGGFARVLVGVRLFPTQALEAALALALAALGTLLVVSGAAAGTACVTILLVYAAGRFQLELTRGDAYRPSLAGLSEAQWISVVAVAGIVAAEHCGVLPEVRWHLVVAGALAFSLCFVIAWRFLGSVPRHRLMHPAHIHDIAVALDTLAAPGNRAELIVATTSLGVQLSRSHHTTGSGAVEHVAISHRDGPMSEESARIIGELVRLLRPTAGRHEVVARGGIFHLLLHR